MILIKYACYEMVSIKDVASLIYSSYIGLIREVIAIVIGRQRLDKVRWFAVSRLIVVDYSMIRGLVHPKRPIKCGYIEYQYGQYEQCNYNAIRKIEWRYDILCPSSYHYCDDHFEKIYGKCHNFEYKSR